MAALAEQERQSLKADYGHLRRRCVLLLIVLGAALAGLFIVALSLSQYPLGFSEAYGVLLNHLTGGPVDGYDAWFKDRIVWEMNLPQVIGGIAVGVILAVGGAVMQPVIKNPLADPFTTGISSGALLGVSLFLAFGFCLVPGLTGNPALIVNAFVFALIPTAAIVAVTALKKQISPTMMILVGIGVMYLFSAASSLVRYRADPDSAHAIFSWTLGTLGRITWSDLWVLVAAAAVILIFALAAAQTLNVIAAGDRLSQSLGVRNKRFRVGSLLLMALTTGVAVAFTGTIGFVGLVCPHIARSLVGANNRLVVPASAMIGATLLIGASCLAKEIGSAGLPVGAVTALICSPIFIYLLVKHHDRMW